jgi:hypothetical protein
MKFGGALRPTRRSRSFAPAVAAICTTVFSPLFLAARGAGIGWRLRRRTHYDPDQNST